MGARDEEQLITVVDADDPRLDPFRDVRDRDLRGPSGRTGHFIVESILPVEQVLAIEGAAVCALMTRRWVDRVAPLLPPGVPAYVAPVEVVRDVTGFTFHRGVLAVGRRRGIDDRPLDDVVPPRDRPATVLVCDGVNNIDNIGLLFRNAAAFACDAVILSPTCHDPLYRKSVRVSIGHVLRVPWARSAAWTDDLDRLTGELGLTLIGASAGPEAVALDDVERPERVGLVVGQEHDGLSAEAAERCASLVRIPMAASVDSLNVAVASAVCLHRLTRGQRR